MSASMRMRGRSHAGVICRWSPDAGASSTTPSSDLATLTGPSVTRSHGIILISALDPDPDIASCPSGAYPPRWSSPGRRHSRRAARRLRQEE